MKINLTALIRSATATIWFVVLATLGGELYPAVKNFFTKVGKQHWTGKSLVAGGLFVALYIILSFIQSRESSKPEKGIYKIIYSAVGGGLIIFGFFLYHFLRG